MDHSGHRARLKRALRENGLMSFAPHEVIELLLYSALPRRDVNELAHRLSDTFGGVNGLLKADKARLMQEGGLTENTAEIILAAGDCVRALSLDEGRGDVFIRTRAEAERLSGNGAKMTLLNSGRKVIFVSDIPSENAAKYIYSHAVLYDAGAVLLSGFHADEELRARLSDAGTELTEV